MGNISHALILTLFIIITISNNAQFHVVSSHSLPYTSHASSPSPSPSKPVTPSPLPPPPAAAPTKPLTKKPTYPPIKPPVVKKKFVAVEGMVYCKSNCTYAGINTLLGASPLPGAKVVMRCRNTPLLLRTIAKTNKKGYFFLQVPPMMTTDGARKCKVYLAHKPKSGGPCAHAADLNGGTSGVYLFSNNTGPPKQLPYFSLFSVGPFTYEPSKCYKH
ncbi:hypothetical protein RND81_10G041300 [Saponaria officinalis]|uniref:Pistil-specific extensin-like protein n=1 Tax=Saponaria officinalis TaxID=3572 RepID=A0AAW1HY98_SAPOF